MELLVNRKVRLKAEERRVVLKFDGNSGEYIEGKIMGTIGMLMAAYEENELTAEEVRECVKGLQRAGRHIGQKHYQMLFDRLKD